MEFSFKNYHRCVKNDIITFTPLDIAKDAETLYKISSGEPYKGHPGFDPKLIWEFLYYKPLLPGFKSFCEYLELVTSIENQVVFTISLTQTGEIVGMHASELNIAAKEVIGGLIWISPIYQGLNIGSEHQLLLIYHAFSVGTKSYIYKVMTTNKKLINSNEQMGIPILRTEMIMFPWHLRYIPGIVYELSRYFNPKL